MVDNVAMSAAALGDILRSNYLPAAYSGGALEQQLQVVDKNEATE